MSETCSQCGYTEIEKPTLPYLCCTCANWDPEKIDVSGGQCSIIGTGKTDFDHSCGSWESCKTVDKNDNKEVKDLS